MRVLVGFLSFLEAQGGDYYLFVFLAAPQGMRDLGSGEGGNPCPLQWALGGLATGLPEKSLEFVFLPFPAFRGCPHSIFKANNGQLSLMSNHFHTTDSCSSPFYF